MNRRFRASALEGDGKLEGEQTGAPRNTQQMSVVRVSSVRAHQQTIMVVASYSDRVVTGSTDHTLRVCLILNIVKLHALKKRRAKVPNY